MCKKCQGKPLILGSTFLLKVSRLASGFLADRTLLRFITMQFAHGRWNTTMTPREESELEV